MFKLHVQLKELDFMRVSIGWVPNFQSRRIIRRIRLTKQKSVSFLAFSLSLYKSK